MLGNTLTKLGVIVFCTVVCGHREMCKINSHLVIVFSISAFSFRSALGKWLNAREKQWSHQKLHALSLILFKQNKSKKSDKISLTMSLHLSERRLRFYQGEKNEIYIKHSKESLSSLWFFDLWVRLALQCSRARLYLNSDCCWQ